jgi:hypothetical protein
MNTYRYCVETDVPQYLLNSMSADGWELVTIQFVVIDAGFNSVIQLCAVWRILETEGSLSE